MFWTCFKWLGIKLRGWLLMNTVRRQGISWPLNDYWHLKMDSVRWSYFKNVNILGNQWGRFPKRIYSANEDLIVLYWNSVCWFSNTEQQCHSSVLVFYQRKYQNVFCFMSHLCYGLEQIRFQTTRMGCCLYNQVVYRTTSPLEPQNLWSGCKCMCTFVIKQFAELIYI
jgi:hypothetical protein